MKKVASAVIALQSGLRCCLSAMVQHPKDAYLRLDKFHMVEAEEVEAEVNQEVGAPKIKVKGDKDDKEESWVPAVNDDKPAGVEAHFGDTDCPCIGFDGREGTITVNFSKTVQVTYPADLGSRCEQWEAGRHPSCFPGGDPGPDKGWCKESWCFVDPCNCKTNTLPQPSDMAPDTTFRGKPLYYSYAACGGKNHWNKQPPNMGKPGCRCVGFDTFPGTTEVTWKDPNTSAESTIMYPADMGGTCRKWDGDTHPMCKGEGVLPEWCTQRWCYVDPCSCNIEEPPKVTMYQPQATYTGKSLYYSYETCGEEDHFTTELNLEACVNQMTPDKCLHLKVRNGIQKCAWTGTRCLGAELVSHPLCDHLGVKAVWAKGTSSRARSWAGDDPTKAQALGRRAACTSFFALGATLLLGFGSSW